MLLKKETKLSNYPNKYIFTKKEDVTYCFYMEGDVLLEVDAEEKAHAQLLNSVYIGKVKNIAKNLNAAFVEYLPGKMAYLELPKANHGSKGNTMSDESTECLPVLNRQNAKRLAQGDELLIQIVKEPLKTKDAVATTNLTLSGTYCVVSNERKTINFSTKLDRGFCKQLKKYVEEFRQEHELPFGAIIRTNAETLTEENFYKITDELFSLQEKLSDIEKKAHSRTTFTQLYDEASFVENKCRNISIEHTDLVVTDDEQIYQTLLEFKELNSFYYKDTAIALNSLLGLNKKLEDACSKKVWLKCGGYLVIEVTEALTVIDVNSGKCVAKKNKEDLISLVNTQAAKEVMHQIRLRNLSGIIIVDFMKHADKIKEKELIQYMEGLAKAEKVQTDIVDMTPLGLMEITRKKISKPLHEKLSQTAMRNMTSGI